MARLQVGYDPTNGRWVAKAGDDVFMEILEGAVGFFGVSTSQAAHTNDAAAIATDCAINGTVLGATAAGVINAMNSNINSILAIIENVGLNAKS